MHAWIIPHLREVAAIRGPEDPALMEEVNFFAEVSGLPAEGIKFIQAFYEIGSIMIPIVNLTETENSTETAQSADGSGVYDKYAHIHGFADIIGEKATKMLKLDKIDFADPKYNKTAILSWFQRPMCTGIIGRAVDGTVYHARNFDNDGILDPITYNANFTLGGKTVFISSQITGFSGAFTAYKPGQEGFALQLNDRFPDHIGGNEQMVENYLIKKRPLVSWEIRKEFSRQNSTFDSLVADRKSVV